MAQRWVVEEQNGDWFVTDSTTDGDGDICKCWSEDDAKLIARALNQGERSD